MNVMNSMQILPGGVGKFWSTTAPEQVVCGTAGFRSAGAAIDELPGWPVTISDNDVMLRAQMKCQAVWDVSFGAVGTRHGPAKVRQRSSSSGSVCGGSEHDARSMSSLPKGGKDLSARDGGYGAGSS